MARSPREVAELVRRMVIGDSEVVFAELFAEDGVMAYPFAPPGAPSELRGREAIRQYFAARGAARGMLEMEGADLAVRETDDPEVIVTEITHYGRSKATAGPYRFTALGIVRVRDGQIVRYDDYMDAIAMARLLGRTDELITALKN
jgi:ketosteroid isomerase-like protein